MSQSGYTPIYIYNSGTATNVPTSGNLGNGELAINYADGKLFYKDSGGNVQVIASKAGNVNVSSFSAGTTGFTPNTATTGAVTLSGTLVTTNGGTGLSTYAAGDLPYYASGTALSKLGIGSSGQILTSTGSAPQWSTLSSVAVTTFSAGTTGFTPSTATSGAVTLAGTLASTNGGTGLTSFTANGVVYASSTSALATGSALSWDTSTLLIDASAAVSQANLRIKTNTGGAVANGYFNINGTDYFRIYTTASNTGLRNLQNTPMYFSINDTEQMRLTSTGLGIGTSSPTEPLNVFTSATGTTAGSNVVSRFSSNGSGYDANITLGDNVNASVRLGYLSGNMYFWTNAAERMRIDLSGNLGLGVTPSAWSAGRAIELGGIGAYLYGGNSLQLIAGTNSYYNAGWKYAATGAASQYQQVTGAHQWFTAASGTAGNAITFTQAMTLDASSNLYLGTTGNTTNGGFNWFPDYGGTGNSLAVIGHKTGSATGSLYYAFNYAGTTIGSITQSGTTAVLYNTTSDQRLKENIVDAPQGNIDGIKVRSFDWIADGSHQDYGMIAQELYDVAPYAVTGIPDSEEMMSVDYSKLVPMMIKEIQSLKAEVATLKGA